MNAKSGQSVHFVIEIYAKELREEAVNTAVDLCVESVEYFVPQKEEDQRLKGRKQDEYRGGMINPAMQVRSET